MLDCHSAHIACKFGNIYEKLDRCVVLAVCACCVALAVCACCVALAVCACCVALAVCACCVALAVCDAPIEVVATEGAALIVKKSLSTPPFPWAT